MVGWGTVAQALGCEWQGVPQNPVIEILECPEALGPPTQAVRELRAFLPSENPGLLGPAPSALALL